MSEQDWPEQEFDLRGYMDLIVHRKWIILGFTAALCVLVAIGTALQPKVYEARASILVGREAPRLIEYDVIPQDRFRERDYLKTQAAILNSRALLQRAVRHLVDEGLYGAVAPEEVESRTAALVKFLQARESIQALTAPDSQMIQIAVEGEIPERVARLANAIAEEYVAGNLDQKQQMASQAVAWLQKKLAEAEIQLRKSQAELQAFRDREKITSADEADPFPTLKLTRLNEEYLTTHIQRIQLESRVEALRKAHSPTGTPGSLPATQSLDADVQRQMRQSLQKEYVDGQVQLKELSQRYGEQHPDIITLKARVEKLERELQALADSGAASGALAGLTGNLADLEVELQALQTKEKFLARTLESQSAEAGSLSRTAVAYALLKQRVDLDDKTYNDLLSRLNTARMSGELKSPGVQILDRADVPTVPVAPKPARNMAVALLLGLALGVGLVLLMDSLDRRVRSPRDAARYLKIPLLSVVPGIGLSRSVQKDEGDSQLVTIRQPKSLAAESYRNLRTSILFSSGGPVPRTILVTSAVAGEGKSTTAANLAVVMAQSGRRTLLIDADLRRPALQRYFRHEKGRGLTGVLEEGRRIEDTVERSEIENLDLLLCYRTPQNPSELLGSEQMSGLIESCKTRYDVILIDSPVVISVPDAVILAARSEAVILVHRPGATDRGMVGHAQKKLEDVKANVLGLVMNNVDVRAGSYQFAQYLYYGYGSAPGGPTRSRKATGGKAC